MDISNISVDYQNWQDKTSWYKHSGAKDTFELSYLVMGLAGESGEATDCVKKLLRKHGEDAWEMSTADERYKFTHEVADVLWYVVRTCTFLGITPQDLMILNMVKLHDRMNERTESGLGPISWPLESFSYEQAKQLELQIWERIFAAGRMGEWNE